MNKFIYAAIAGVLFALSYFVFILSSLASCKPEQATYTVQLPAQATVAAWQQHEVECLARTIYGEARNQPYHGQVAVGAVVVARSLHPSWPSDLCKVVSQKGQFGGFYLGTIKEQRAWKVALKAAMHATEGFGTLPESYRTSYFFRNETDGSFARFAKRKGRIADHYFYGLKT